MHQLRILRLTFLAILAAVIGWTAFVLSRPNPVMISYMNDDAFYYLVPAYSFAHGQGWSFDHITRTSGFQILYAYVAAIVSLGAGYTRAFPIVMTWSSAAALLLGVWHLLKRTGALYGAGIAAVATALTMAAPRAFLQITNGLEWGWAVMLTALFVASLEAGAPSVWAVAAAAFFATLTRVDLSIFVAIYAVAIAWSRWQADRGSLKNSFRLCIAAAAGSIVAVVLTGVNSRAIAGQWVPNSVAMKEFWSRTNPFRPAIGWDLILSCTGPGAILTSLRATLGLRSFIVMGLSFAGAAVVCWSEWRKGPDRRGIALASTAAMLAYTLAYARGVNLIADHYSASIIVPMAFLTAGLLAMSRRYWPAVGAAMAVGVVVVAVHGSWSGNAAHLVLARHAEELFAQAPSGARVAAWNAGIAGWRTGGRVINLDGLANANVVEPIKSGRLACFLSEQQVDHFLDFGFMFAGEIDPDFGDAEAAHQIFLDRNGYDSARLYRCLTVKATADDDTVPGSKYRLFSIDKACLAALCPRR